MRGRASRLALLSLVVSAAVACGSRTGLFLDEEAFGPNPTDAGPVTDASRRDSGRDVVEIEDAPPPLDVTPPQDVNRIDCAEAGTTYVYLISNSYQLYSFDPSTNSTKFIGNIACSGAGNADTPFSMAVDRKGVAYILFTDERLYRVSTLNAACLSTSYVPRQSNFGLFGMGFVFNDDGTGTGPTEHLYVSGDRRNNSASGIARIDVTNFKLTPIGDPNIEHAELTGTGGGALYAFYKRSLNSPPSFIGELDTKDGHVSGEKQFDTIDQGQGWAFAFWGGDFYMFHAPSGNSVVTRWRPSDDTVVQVATLPSVIVGAGVSTCAPQE